METKNIDYEFNYEEGFKTIYEMIRSVRTSISKNHFYYLLWGYLVIAASITDFVMLKLEQYRYHYYAWLVLMSVGCIATLVYILFQQKTYRQSSYLGRFMGYFWGAWFVSFIILMSFVNMKSDYETILPVCLAMYGLGLFVSGAVLRFKPLIAGGIVSWIAAVTAFFMTYQVQLLIMAVTVTVSHLIPGYILKKER